MTRCWLALGRRDEAESAAAGAQASAAAVGLRSATAMAYRATAAVAVDAGDAATGAKQALAAAELSDDVGTPVEAGLARTIAGRALAQLGERTAPSSSYRQLSPSSNAVAPVATATPQSENFGDSANTSTGAPDPATPTRPESRP